MTDTIQGLLKVLPEGSVGFYIPPSEEGYKEFYIDKTWPRILKVLQQDGAAYNEGLTWSTEMDRVYAATRLQTFYDDKVDSVYHIMWEACYTCCRHDEQGKIYWIRSGGAVCYDSNSRGGIGEKKVGIFNRTTQTIDFYPTTT